MISRIESEFAKILSKFPNLKSKIKYLYLLLNSFFYKKNFYKTFNSDLNKVSNSASNTFFGYHDKSPESPDGTHTIFLAAKDTVDSPSSVVSVKVFLRNNLDNSELLCFETLAYNWQQGSRLMWLNNSKFIFNSFNKEQKILDSVIYNIKTHKMININYPVYDCFKDNFAISLDFTDISNTNKEYSYTNIISHNNYKKTIVYINLVDFSIQSLLKYNDIIEFESSLNIDEYKHEINHISISPFGNKFVFVHRWYNKKNGVRNSRLLLYDLKTKKLKTLLNYGMVSHFSWVNELQIVGFFNHPSFGNNFYNVNIDTLEINIISRKLISFGDGHPNILNNKMVFDSYPNRKGVQSLYLFDLQLNELTKLGDFHHPINFFGSSRCDLHPRFNYKGDKIFIDSVFSGKRSLYELKTYE